MTKLEEGLGGGASLADALRYQAARLGGRPYVSIEDGPVDSFADVLAASEDVARRLASVGVGPGEFVVIMARTSLAVVHAWFAASVLGASEVPLNTAYRGQTLAHAVNLSGARVAVADAEFLPLLAEVEHDLTGLELVVCLDQPTGATLFASVEVRVLAELPAESPLPEVVAKPGDIASVLLTSGTTGPAKGVLLPNGQTRLMGERTAAWFRITEDDVLYCFHSLFHATKFTMLYTALVVGARVVLDRAFDPPTWSQRIRQFSATVTVAHGPMIEMILALPEDPSDSDNSLRVVLTAGVTPPVMERFEDRFGVTVVEGFAMTEGYPIIATRLDEARREGSCGRPFDDLWDVALVDPDTDQPVAVGEVGELTFRPHLPWTMMQGYLGMPDKTLESWRNLRFHSGDMMRRDADGFYYFVDRASDRIRRRAENVSAYEIECAARDFENVAECAAVGVPSGLAHDDDIKLTVVVDDATTLDYAGLVRHLVGRLPRHMIPLYIEVLPALPRSTTGKVKKAQLRRSGSSGAWDRKAAGLSVRKVIGSRSRPPLY